MYCVFPLCNIVYMYTCIYIVCVSPVMSLKCGRAAQRRSMSARFKFILEHSLELLVLGLQVNVLT